MWSRSRLGARDHEPYVPLLGRLAGGAGGAGGAGWVTPPDPDRFVTAGAYHGVAGQLLEAVADGRVRLPPASVKSLEAWQARRLVTSALLRRELVEVAPIVAEAAGAPTVLLKGPAVADRFYARPELRPFVDLDLMVPLERVEAAAQRLIRERGYARTATPWPQNLVRHGHALELARRAGMQLLNLELHWRVSNDPLATSLEHARLVTTATPRGDVASVCELGPAEQLVVLALHLINHDEWRLYMLLDVANVGAAATAAEWQSAFDLADDLRVGWVLDAALDLAERHVAFVRPRPRPAPAPQGWGPLRASLAIGGGVGFHLGHLAILDWPERLWYLATGAWRRLALSPPASGRRLRPPRSP